jgi:predicted flap endonuclease-1-like 5' DNA nuclease
VSAPALLLGVLPVGFALILYALWRSMRRSQSVRDADWELRFLAEAQRAGDAQARLDLERVRSAKLEAELCQLRRLAEDRRRLFGALADARADIARLRQVLIDIEDDAPPPILAGAGDDLKLIVGVGPVLERLLQRMGVTTFAQIAQWTERDVEAFDTRLEDFHGRVRRDDWITQARELHYQKYGERLGAHS